MMKTESQTGWISASRVRLVLSLLVVVTLAVLFWTGSRYPSLDEKAMMSGALVLEDPLSFEAVIPVDPDADFVSRVTVSAVNWIDTNKKGMTFGLLMGAAFLTFLGYLRRRSFSGPFANSLYGMFLGAPLGVCVNCAAPIAKGLYQGGSRAETTLSAMIASPTLNVVVMTMALSLLPFYIFLTKFALSLVVILIGVPLICRFLPEEKLLRTVSDGSDAPTAPGMEDANPLEAQPQQGVIEFVRDFGRNLWFILRTTMPLMILAGVLGALVANLLPPDLLTNSEAGPLAILATAIAGTFLPVPIGFDVVVSGVLMNAGVGHGFVMTLVFTLGSFSIYSFMIVAGSVGWRAAGMLGAMVIVLGALAGGGAELYHRHQTRQALEMLTRETPAPATDPSQDARPEQGPAEPALPSTSSIVPTQLTVSSTPLNPPSAAADSLFTREEAWRSGIDHPLEFSFGDMWPPFWEGRSVSSGDIDGDGDVDLVYASTRQGLYIYANDGAGRFERLAPLEGRIAEMPIFNAVLVDIDNSGWLDLFFTTYRQGMYVIPNEGGQLNPAAMRRVENRGDAILALAVSFGDLDRDGYLDLATGNWAAGWYRRIPGEESRNRVIFNDAGQLSGRRFTDLPGIPGETLSILFSDVDQDGWQDLLVGNDFEVPDYFYFNDGTGGLEAVTYQDGRVPMTTTTTMSLNSADLNADGYLDIYAGQIAGRASGISSRLRMQPIGNYCQAIERAEDRAVCQQNIDIKQWYRAGNSLDPGNARRCAELAGTYVDECRGMMIKDLAIQTNNPGNCELIPASQPRIRSFCEIHFLPSRDMTRAEQDAAIRQILTRNVLLQQNAEGGFDERAEAMSLEIGGWTWDVSVADFDLDGYLDVYIVNGTWVPNEVTPSNIYLRNTGQGEFEEMTEASGLTDFLMTAAATTTDIDGDGDLDILTVPVNGPPVLFRNNQQDNGAVRFSFDDAVGNRSGVGVRLTAGYASGVDHVRELQLGGGFMSFDDPSLVFGVPSGDTLETVRVDWPDGGSDRLDGPFEAGHAYEISRRPVADDGGSDE